MIEVEKVDKFAAAEIRRRAAQMIKTNTEIRYGQAIFNAAFAMFPRATNQLRSTKYDCFYDDSKVTDFLTQLTNC